MVTTSLRFFAFWKDTRGAATVETVLCIPIFVILLGLIIDTSLIFARQSDALRVLQDANRALSIGLVMTTDATEQAIVDRLATLSPNVSVTTTMQDGVIFSRAVMPAGDLSNFGFYPAFTGLEITVVAQHLSEG